ncbi:glycerol-3-phosphate dehydrogenase [Motilimonas cestriensis]|uniref:Glycerol-3-phosphate dehydrogenase n=1 Tax=Motilimonas cestriensis TaxID=2742685 RepID=A0ABS8W328_9GAMM|nr:glycerol-3-phosphate dehydrogenase [Motilimonas cestriensis]MCE2593349.1 glycerol-3-phosphate dehydrogenase [Motilimonas cestriensis]
MNKQENVNDVLDLIIVGGGINGAGIAADAAGRQLKVGLYESSDFASATSSASSKLIHGGLRYLEHYEFRLVSESLAEREVLLKKAPHIAKPMRFRLPHRPFLRPAWMIRAGLFLYDHLGKRTTLKGSHGVDFRQTNVLKDEMVKGFEYSDCWVDDARLVLLNIQQAEQHGAEIKNYCHVEKAERVGELWQVTLLDKRTNTRFQRQARALVNATGPWVRSFITDNMDAKSPYGIRLIKGSHIIVPKIHNEEQAYILQNDDQRIVFVIPYLEDYSLIGTTDVEFKGDARKVEIDQEEVDYLIKIVNKHFIHQIKRDDVVSSFSGVRPLCDDESDSPQAITRDYTLSLEQKGAGAPLLSIFGGKLTTYRKLAEAAMKQLAPFFPRMGGSWTADSLLPGAQGYDEAALSNQLRQQCAWLSDKTIRRYCQLYGTQVNTWLQGITTEAQMGQHFGQGVYQCEIDYLITGEYAFTAQDILWRRTKLGIILNADEQSSVSNYVAQQLGRTPKAQSAVVQPLFETNQKVG